MQLTFWVPDKHLGRSIVSSIHSYRAPGPQLRGHELQTPSTGQLTGLFEARLMTAAVSRKAAMFQAGHHAAS